MKIIFFGSTDFSLPIISKIKDNFCLLGVVIVKPKPKGRGLKITLPKVAEWAENAEVTVFSPDNPNEESFITNISALEPDLFVLSAYGCILSKQLLEIPRLGGLNVHPSLLPKYRGAAPIQRAIMAGEKKTGITLFFMDEKIDHGTIIFQRALSIEPNDTYGSLLPRLSMLGAEVIVDVLKSIEEGNYKSTIQKEEDKTYALKIKKEKRYINWQDSTEKIFNLIRALSPKPGARAFFRGKELMIIQAQKIDRKLNSGIVHIENKNLFVGTIDGSIILKEVKPAGRSKISGLDFINGFRIKEGEKIE